MSPYAEFLDALRRRRDELRDVPFVRPGDWDLLAKAKCQTVDDLLRDLSDAGPALLAIATLRGMLGHEGVVEPLEQGPGARLVVGSLHVPGDLTNAGVLAVTGDVTVNGTYAEDGASAQLLVGGKLEVEHLVAEGPVHVLGDLRASGLVFVRGRDHDVAVGGELAARVLVEDHKSVRFGTLRCGRHVREARDFAAVLPSEVVTADGLVDLAELRARLRDHMPAILSTIPPAASTLSPRIAGLVDSARAAVEWRIEDFQGRPCLVLRLADGSRQRSFLRADERIAFELAIGAR